MRQNKKNGTDAKVVGVVDSSQALRIAKNLGPGTVDFLEWRADCLAPTNFLPHLRFPWIITARHPREGGAGALNTATRRARLLDILDDAAAVDIEVRSLKALSDVLDKARSSNIRIIASFHDFRTTPSSKKLKEIIQRARDAGADVVKIATVTHSAAEAGRLLSLFTSPPVLPLAIMGMGPLGMASRLLLASCGSVLNYGWLARPNVSGQWSARELRELLSRLQQRQ